MDERFSLSLPIAHIISAHCWLGGNFQSGDDDRDNDKGHISDNLSAHNYLSPPDWSTVDRVNTHSFDSDVQAAGSSHLDWTTATMKFTFNGEWIQQLHVLTTLALCKVKKRRRRRREEETQINFLREWQVSYLMCHHAPIGTRQLHSWSLLGLNHNFMMLYLRGGLEYWNRDQEFLTTPPPPKFYLFVGFSSRESRPLLTHPMASVWSCWDSIYNLVAIWTRFSLQLTGNRHERSLMTHLRRGAHFVVIRSPSILGEGCTFLHPLLVCFFTTWLF